MSDKGNNKNAVWLYAVILFTSAFIVLLITALSQIKLNSNLSEYKNKLFTEESAKNDVKTNLGAALSENSRLNGELNTAKKELEEANSSLNSSNEMLKDIQQKYIDKVNTYESLLNAQYEYNRGEVLKSAELLYNGVNTLLLDKSGIDVYDALAQKAIVKAAETFFSVGYKNYTEKKYEEAIFNLIKSYNYSDRQYFSDDCLYFIAYSEYRIGNSTAAKIYMEKLTAEFPDSNYESNARDLIKKIQDGS